MLKEQILRKAFAWSAIIFAGIFLEMSPILMRSPLPYPMASFHAQPFDIVLMLARELILIMPAVAAFACGMAWWTLRKNAPDARHWSILASVSMITLSTPFFVADFTLLRYVSGRSYDFAGVLAVAVALCLIGITGVATFTRRNHADSARVSSHAHADALAPTA